MEEDHYELLGVARDATSQDIKRAFREIARKCHPDVAGGDVAAEERFKASRLAYETLMDPVGRARYDRRSQRKGAPPPAGGSFFDAFWKASEKNYEKPSRVNVRAAAGRKNSGNDVSLDDLFNGWGNFPNQAAEPKGGDELTTGGDVKVEVEVPFQVAREGGSVTVVYHRLVRADGWRPGSPDPGLVKVQDLQEIRIIPGTRHGEVLQERGQGDAGPHGGPFGDLYCTVRIAGARQRAATPPPPRARTVPPPPGREKAPAGAKPSEPPPIQPEAAPDRGPDAPDAGAPADASLDITVVEALLGGRVSVETPQGRVRATIPPGTSSGIRMRLKAKGPVGPDGQPTDWYLVTRIVVPPVLDAESRRLIEEFARLNP